MQVWQIILLSYVGALVAWLVINAFFLLISFVMKKKVFMFLEGITSVLALILGFATGIGDLALIVWLFTHNQIFWAILAFLLGIGLVSFAGQVLAAPFIFITAGFSAWYDSL